MVSTALGEEKNCWNLAYLKQFFDFQRRLQELQANQKVIRPVVDSSSLGFREKMRIFAEQLGEQKLPAFGNQHKSSSAERRIAQIGQNEGEKAEEEEEKNIGKHREWWRNEN